MATLKNTLLTVLACTIALPMVSDAGTTRYLAKSPLLCDTERVACMRGSVTYDEGTATLAVLGRVTRARKAGTLTFMFESRQYVLEANGRKDYSVYRFIDVPVGGRSSQIIDQELVTGEGLSTTNWQLRCIFFVADGEDLPRVYPPACG